MDASFWDEIERSRKLTGAQRVSESLRLSDQEREARLAELQAQFPEASPEQVREMFVAELETERREKHEFIENRGILP